MRQNAVSKFKNGHWFTRFTSSGIFSDCDKGIPRNNVISKIAIEKGDTAGVAGVV